MQSKWLLSSALVGCFAFGWCAHLLTAQHRKPVTITRIYTGSDGETHAEEITGNLKSDPSRNGIEFSDPIKVTSLVFARTSPGWVRDWHQETYRQYLITLSGTNPKALFEKLSLVSARWCPLARLSQTRMRVRPVCSRMTAPTRK